MGLFGGGNSSKTTNNISDNRALNAAGNSGLAVNGDGNRITATDHGAIREALNAVNGGTQNALSFAGNFGENALDNVAAFGEQAMSLTGHSLSESLNFARDNNDQVFDAIDRTSEAAFNFVGSAFDASLSESKIAREDAVGAVLESNKRISEIYETAGRESQSDAFTALKIGAALIGLIGVGVLLRV